ncbi:hypothetical protein V5H98_12155 [Georgenia sp. M64]|uniref:hypothetical protein n=1 Tax=Georgenia sp. M64 TaxID=3120520 RepID=UPI0030E179BC
MTALLLPRSENRPAQVALDLTALGVTADDDLGADLPVAKADLARLASYTRAAHEAGVDFVALGEGFRLRTDRVLRPESWLDPVVAARRIGPHAGPGGLVAAVPAGADLRPVAAELAQVGLVGTAWAGVQTRAGAPAARLAGEERPARGTGTRVVVEVRDERDVETAGSFADVVRIREQDAAWARELRFAVRAAARAAGRGDIPVLVDLHAVVSTQRSAAVERAALVADIAGGAPWTGALAGVGTVSDVADTIEAWVTGGSADGVVVVPGSVPADVAALVHGLLPELRGRGLLAPATTAVRPVRVPSAPAARVAAARRPAAARVAVPS